MDQVAHFFTRTPWGRLVLLQGVLFVVAAVLSLLIGVLYSTALMIVGAFIVVFRFAAGMGQPAMHEGTGLPASPLVIGLIPLLVGVALAFV